MNNTFDNIYDTDFNNAIELCNQNYSYKELIELLESPKIVEKQFAILSLDKIENTKDALKLSSLLTGQDGKIREICAFKLNEIALNPRYREYFIQEEIFKILINGFMDINGNICRMIVNLIQIEEFKEYLSHNLPQRLRLIIEEIKPMDLKSKQYLLSKKNFQLYWNLEALYFSLDKIEYSEIKGILLYCCEFVDYTIREKSAKILSKYTCADSQILRTRLTNDDNYYVKRYFKDKCACSSAE